MPCKLDIKKAILDKAFQTKVEDRYTYDRLSDDTIQISNSEKSKAKSNASALRIAQNLGKSIEKLFKGQITAFPEQYSEFDPVTLHLQVSPAYIEYEYNKLPEERRTDPREFERDLAYFNYDQALMDQENISYNKDNFYSKEIDEETKSFLEKELDIKYDPKKPIYSDIRMDDLLKFAENHGNLIQSKLAKILRNKIKIENSDPYIDQLKVLRAYEHYNINQTDDKINLAFYNPNTSQIAINLAAFSRYPLERTKWLLARTINHEIIHHFTLASINENVELNSGEFLFEKNKFQSNLSELFDIANKNNKNNEYFYGLTNEKEFVTEAMSNIDFQRYLASIPYGNKNKTIWTRFVEIVTAFFDVVLSKDITNTLLKEVINLVSAEISKNDYFEFKKRPVVKSDSGDEYWEFNLVSPNENEFERLGENIENKFYRQAFIENGEQGLREISEQYYDPFSRNQVTKLYGQEIINLATSRYPEDTSVSLRANIEDDGTDSFMIMKGDRLVGNLKYFDDGEYITVNDVKIDLERQGIGTDTYLRMAEIAIEKNRILRSDEIDTKTNEASRGLWNIFVRLSLAEKQDNHYVFTGNPTEFIEQDILQPSTELEEMDESEENNEDLTEDTTPQEVDNELNSKFEDLLSKGIISQICI